MIRLAVRRILLRSCQSMRTPVSFMQEPNPNQWEPFRRELIHNRIRDKQLFVLEVKRHAARRVCLHHR